MAKSSDAEIEILAVALYESFCRTSPTHVTLKPLDLPAVYEIRPDWFGLTNADRWHWRKRAQRRVEEYASGDPEDEGPW